MVAENLHQLQQTGCPAHRVTLEEALAVDAVRRADQRAWPALDMTDHPFADRLEIAGEIEFCHGFAVTRVRPHYLVGMGDDHAHHLGGFALSWRRPRLNRLAGFGRRLCDRFGEFGHGRLFRLHLPGGLVLA